MLVPKLLLTLPLLLGGFLLPGSASPALPTSGATIGMSQEGFTQDSVTIKVGQRLTLLNSSTFLHVIMPGMDSMAISQQGMPGLDGRFDTHVSETGDSYTTAVWDAPGTYHVTCTLHHEMNLEVIVLPR